MVELADTGVFVYCATCSFASSALSSDLLFIRFCLTLGFLFLVLNSLHGYAASSNDDGSYFDFPMNTKKVIIDIPLLVNMILFALNLFVCIRFVLDERPQKRYNPTERALFRYFQSRCGLTPLQFRHILQQGDFVEYPPHHEIPACQTTLYLVLEGKVECRAKYNKQLFGETYIKRSGEFFDIKLFNFFLPVGFDNTDFHAKTVTRTKLFAWKMEGLVTMRDLQSPTLKPFWEYIVLRSLSAVAIRSHLKAHETLYDSLSVPERPEWLEGAPSRDFVKHEKPVGNWQHFKRQIAMIRSSLLHIIPPHGVRQRPAIIEHNPKQAYFELLCQSHGTDEAEGFRFLQANEDKQEEKRIDIFSFIQPHTANEEPKQEGKRIDIFSFLQPNKDGEGANHKDDVECPSS